MHNDPGYRIGEQWMLHMRRGDFEAAWKISDAVLHSRTGRRRDLPRHLQSIWDGSALESRRVLIRCYHGLGDTIQFVRYVPLVKAIATEVIVWAPSSLLSLLSGIRGIDRLVPLHNGEPDVGYDADVEVMELPHVFRTTLSTIPADVPYLHIEPTPLPNKGKQRVGLIWEAGSWDRRRSIPVRQLLPWRDVTQIEWHVLQRGPALANLPPGFRRVTGSDDVLEAAKLIAALDLVISVDTMPAHLAGALRIPVWTLLHAEADWRWIEAREDSPWYPSMRVFRQQRSGEWGPVIDRIAAELRRL